MNIAGCESETDMVRLNIAPFCANAWQYHEKNCIELIWADPRDLNTIEIEFVPEKDSKKITNHHIAMVEYWRTTWPHNRPDPNAKRGSGRSGWTKQDDWYQGLWQKADYIIERSPENPDRWIISFNNLATIEFPQEKYNTTTRRTLKLRITFTSPIDAQQIRNIECYTTTELVPRTFKVLFPNSHQISEEEEFSIRIFNGIINLSENQSPIEMKKGRPGQIYSVLSSIPPFPECFDETQVTLTPNSKLSIQSAWNQPITFTFTALEKSPIYLPDFNILIVSDKETRKYDQIEQDFALNKPIAPGTSDSGQFDTSYNRLNKSVYDRIFEMPDRKFTDAMGEFAGKARFYAVIGCAGTRLKAAITLEGYLAIPSQFIRLVPHRDTPRLFWRQEYAQIRSDWTIDGVNVPHAVIENPKSRSYDPGIPVFNTQWDLFPQSDRALMIKQHALVTPLEGLDKLPEPEGDCEMVAILRYRIENPTDMKRNIDWEMYPGDIASLHDTSAVFNRFPAKIHQIGKSIQSNENILSSWEFEWKSKPPRPNYRFQLQIPLSSTIEIKSTADSEIFILHMNVKGHDYLEYEVKLPLCSIDHPDRLHELHFQAQRTVISRYWENLYQKGASITVPAPEISAFYRKHFYHMLLSSDKDIGSDRIIGRVGAMGYGCYANEVCMMTMDLDRRGFFDDARRMLDTFIHYQSTDGLDGAYEEIDGIYFGANGYQRGKGYNQNQGFVLWAIAEHAYMSHDWAWIKANIDSILLACNWIINERKEWMRQIDEQKVYQLNLLNPSDQPEYYGLLPPGGVEDITDYWYWISTNAYNYYGLAQVGKILAIIQHPEAARIQQEAHNFGDAIRTNFLRLMHTSPVVQLKDGTSIPHIPCHIHRRGRGFGWIQETLEGAIHLIRCELVHPLSREATWIIKDLEDNCYLSEEFGYPVIGTDFEKYWFTRGGFSQQPFLLCNHMIHALRNDYKPFLRATFNAFAVDYRPDTQMFTEHPLPTMWDWFGHHFKCSDEAQFCGCLRTMFCHEVDSTQELMFIRSDTSPIQSKSQNEAITEKSAVHTPDALRIFPLIPREWLGIGKTVACTKLPTYFGMYSASIEFPSTVHARINIQIENQVNGNPFHLNYLFITVRHPNETYRIDKVKGISGNLKPESLRITSIDPNVLQLTVPPDGTCPTSLTISLEISLKSP
jgi:hypothetical protein